jgi:hypothetical protein
MVWSHREGRVYMGTLGDSQTPTVTCVTMTGPPPPHTHTHTPGSTKVDTTLAAVWGVMRTFAGTMDTGAKEKVRKKGATVVALA